MESLSEFAPRSAERRDLVDALNAFGDASETQRIAHPDDGPRCRTRGMPLVHPIDEDARDLQLLHGKPLQIRERRIPGAEVVDGDAYAECAEVAQLIARDALLVDERALGDLEHEVLAGYSGLLQRRPHLIGESRLEQLDRRDIDIHRQCRVTARDDTREVLERSAKHPTTDRENHARHLGHGYEALRWNLAQPRVRPAHQGLVTDDRLVREPHDRLIFQAHLEYQPIVRLADE